MSTAQPSTEVDTGPVSLSCAKLMGPPGAGVMGRLSGGSMSAFVMVDSGWAVRGVAAAATSGCGPDDEGPSLTVPVGLAVEDEFVGGGPQPPDGGPDEEGVGHLAQPSIGSLP